MNKYIFSGLSIAGGLLTALAWSEWCPGLILLVALVPFFILENEIFIRSKTLTPITVFIYLLPGFLLFCMLSMGWLRSASITGAVMVIAGLTFVFSLIGWFSHLIRLKFGTVAAVIVLVSLWLSVELITHNLDIITPWVNLGNGLAKDIRIIQWYDITGTAGGTLWILISNILLASVLVNISSGLNNIFKYMILWTLIISIPIIISLSRYSTITSGNGKANEIVIVQPNFDPFTTKFTIPFMKQLQKSLTIAESAVTDNTKWVLTPETTVDDPVNEENIKQNGYVRMVNEFVKKYPGAEVVTGMITYRVYSVSDEKTPRSARFADSIDKYIDHFNSALKIDSTQQVEIYHKSKLVPGIEKQWVAGPGRIIVRILPFLGGSQWGYGSQQERTVFDSRDHLVKVAPVICYESVFGCYVSDYIQKGAGLIFIITNDGWWKNTNGYKQHFAYARLRAIENRRPVARAGNTGISAFIDIKGNVISKTEWWTQGYLKGELIPETRLTFYTKHGDWLLKIGVVIFLLSMIYFSGLLLYRKYKRN